MDSSLSPREQEEQVLLETIDGITKVRGSADSQRLSVEGWPRCRTQEVFKRLLSQGKALQFPFGVMTFEAWSKKQ